MIDLDLIVECLTSNDSFYELKYFPQIKEGEVVFRVDKHIRSNGVDLTLNFDFKKKIIMPVISIFDTTAQRKPVINNPVLQIASIKYDDEKSLRAILLKINQVDIYNFGLDIYNATNVKTHKLTMGFDICEAEEKHLL